MEINENTLQKKDLTPIESGNASLEAPCMTNLKFPAKPLESEDTREVLKTGIRWSVAGTVVVILAKLGINYVKDKDKSKTKDK